jgi:hypothetical protein
MKNLRNRRDFVTAGACALATPYFFVPTIVKANPLTDGLVDSVHVTVDNLGMTPSGQQNGRDVSVAGGGTVFGRTIRGQADLMAGGRGTGFTEIEHSSPVTQQVCSNGTGYLFARFTKSFTNCCLPLGVVASQNTDVYAGAMTLLEGPNLVGLQVMTTLLKERNNSSERISDLCWPIRPSIVAARERAVITFEHIAMIKDNNGEDAYADRDALFARSAVCALRYTHVNGKPDGGGEGALIVNRQVQFQYEFRYNTEILRA